MGEVLICAEKFKNSFVVRDTYEYRTYVKRVSGCLCCQKLCLVPVVVVVVVVM